MRIDLKSFGESGEVWTSPIHAANHPTDEDLSVGTPGRRMDGAPGGGWPAKKEHGPAPIKDESNGGLDQVGR